MNFIIQKLKSKHTSLKKYSNWAKLIYFYLVLREREGKNQIFRTLVTEDKKKFPSSQDCTSKDFLCKCLIEYIFWKSSKANIYLFTQKTIFIKLMSKWSNHKNSVCTGLRHIFNGSCLKNSFEVHFFWGPLYFVSIDFLHFLF